MKKNIGKINNFFLNLRIPYFILALLFSIVSLKYLYVPYFWILMVWCPFFLHLSLKSQKGNVKALFFNIFLLTLLLGFVELLFSDVIISKSESHIHKKHVTFENLPNKEFMYRHDVLGYAPTPNNTVIHKERYWNGDTLEVTYNINKNGLRKVMFEEKEQYERSIVFFGCSFTFGEAVNDNETLPYYVGEKTGWKYYIYNFGFEGYGAHQMLAALRHGIVSNTVRFSPKYVIYQGLVDHIDRAVRGHSWIKYGPKYLLNKGELIDAGQFDDTVFENILFRQLRKSFVIKRLVEGVNRKLRTANAVELFLSIVEESHNIVKNIYPNSEFHVILWNTFERYYRNYDTNKIVNGLRNRGITVHEIKYIIPEYSDKTEEYVVGHNGHPNALAYEKIAEYVTTKIIE